MINSPKTPCDMCGAALNRRYGYATIHFMTTFPDLETDLKTDLDTPVDKDLTICAKCQYDFIFRISPELKPQLVAQDWFRETEGEQLEERAKEKLMQMITLSLNCAILTQTSD